MAGASAVFFDVDFTLIHPGPKFQGVGYRATCARYGLEVDAARFDLAVAGAASVLDSAAELYEDTLYLTYTRRIIELMGGVGPGADHAARELYDEWAVHHHFSLYDDVTDTLHALRAGGLRLGLISNSHRPLDSFQTHFDLEDLIEVCVSSSEYRYMKPHPQIFQTALDLMRVPAGEAVMVGDSLMQDVKGAERVGMRGILIARSSTSGCADEAVTVIRTLAELPSLL